jgi:hypothetical protein
VLAKLLIGELVPAHAQAGPLLGVLASPDRPKMRLSLDITLSHLRPVTHSGDIITVKHFVMTKGFGRDHGELSSLHDLNQGPFLRR